MSHPHGVYELHLGACTEVEFSDVVVTQGPEDDNTHDSGDDEASADDPDVLGVQPSGRTWQPVALPSNSSGSFAGDAAPTFLICGHGLGATTLHVRKGSTEKATYLFEVTPVPR